MNYPIPQKRNSGRMAMKEEAQAPSSSKEDALDDFQSILGSNSAATTAPATSPAATKTPVAPESAPASNEGQSKAEKPKKDKPHKTKKSPLPDEDDTAGKEKFSIYLPPKLAMALKMVHITTKKKYTQTTEEALRAMIFRRYQCNECTTRFSISESDALPTCCPVCGQKNIVPLRLDLLE